MSRKFIPIILLTCFLFSSRALSIDSMAGVWDCEMKRPGSSSPLETKSTIKYDIDYSTYERKGSFNNNLDGSSPHVINIMVFESGEFSIDKSVLTYIPKDVHYQIIDLGSKIDISMAEIKESLMEIENATIMNAENGRMLVLSETGIVESCSKRS